MNNLNPEQIVTSLQLLGEILALDGRGPFRIAVCGGAGLIACSLVSRQTTRDVDVVALINEQGLAVSPDPLPPDLLRAAERVGRDHDLPPNWLNNGPSREPGGLFQLGLPAGFATRLSRRDFGPNLTVFFVGRFDQICFKVYAAVDQGAGRHVDDLRDLHPTPEELETAARWAMTHDPSEGFRTVLTSMFRQLGYENVAARL
jgi:hypothetical protein